MAGLHAHEDAGLFECSLKRETIDHGSEHALYVIGGRRIHPLIGWPTIRARCSRRR